MKTATVTWVSYNNYGTMLQAYALQQFLLSNGIDNTIVSDKEIIEEQHGRINSKNIHTKEHLSFTSPQKTKIERFVQRIKKYCLSPQKLIRAYKEKRADLKDAKRNKIYKDTQEKFDVFKNTKLLISKPYNTSQLNDLSNQFDLFLCGSDQIWSVFRQNFNGYFYLNFTDKKKISYASSIGTENISTEQMETIKKWLNDFSAISVRESQTARQLSENIGKEVEWVVDPTLLFDKNFWSHFAKDGLKIRKRYIICYFLRNNEQYFRYAEKLAQCLKLKILLIPGHCDLYKKRECVNSAIGPCDFVSLIQNAKFVLTDSYHATLFSLIFNKSFLCFKRFEETDEFCQNIRIVSLLEKINLENRFVDSDVFLKEHTAAIDYKEINEIISNFTQKSKEFLLNNLKENCNDYR